MSQKIQCENGKISELKSIDDEGFWGFEPPKPGKSLIISPGFLNLHCHLSYTDLPFSSLEAKLGNESNTKSKLFDWLLALGEKTFLNQNNPGEELDFKTSALNGAKESLSYGTTFLIDNTSEPQESLNAFLRTGLKGIIGLEVFGSDSEQAEEIFSRQTKQIADLENLIQENLAKCSDRRNNSHQLEFCLSPHATYDVSKALWKLCLDWSQSNNKAFLTHVAESEEEENWFKEQNAPSARKFWERIGTLAAKEKSWEAYSSSVQYLLANDLLSTSNEKITDEAHRQDANKSKFVKLLTHMVQVSDEDLETLNQFSNLALVACPRSNELLGNLKDDKVNVAKWEELGFKYALGTDSKASNHDLDLRKEVNSLSKYHKLSAKRKLEILTSDPAKILGLDQELGSLDIGKSADYVVYELDREIDFKKEDPLELLFDTELCQVKEVYINGKQVFHKEKERSESSNLQEAI